MIYANIASVFLQENMRNKGTSPREEACEGIMYEGAT